MPITMTLLIGEFNDANQASYTTGTITPTANSLVLYGIHSVRSVSPPAVPTVTSNTGLNVTWTQVETIPFNPISAPISRGTLFRALHASPGSGTTTIDFGAVTQERCAWIIAEFAGVDTGGTNGAAAVVQAVTKAINSATVIDPVLANFGDPVNNAAYILACLRADIALDHEAGWTEISEQNPTENFRTAAAWRVGEDTTPTYTWATLNPAGGVAVEIKVAPAAAGIATRQMLMRIGKLGA